jgi:PPIC-type PPIASE domain
VLRRLLREPLLHFLVLGAGVFLLYAVINGGRSAAPRAIEISEARTAALAENFAVVWMRPPTPAELNGLIDDYVAEEIYYREALAMGLDQDDTVIRRRLRQKMEFMADGVADAVAPDDAQLEAFLKQNAAKFAEPAALSFRQVFLSAERRGDAVRADAEKLLSNLQADQGAARLDEVGDPTLLPPAMAAASPQEISGTFGEAFVQQVVGAPVGQWSGPFESAFGLHLVYVDERGVGRAPALQDVRPLVLREWQAAERQRQNKSFLAALRARYEVRIEGPAAELFETTGAGGAAR